MHGEELVVLFLGRHDLETRGEKLGTDHQCHDTAEQEVNERRNQVEVSDLLVVCGRNPLHKDIATTRNTRVGKPLRDFGYGGPGRRRGHGLLSCGFYGGTGQVLQRIQLST